MSSEIIQGVDLHYSFQQQNVRLLELPSQLADIVAGPSRQTLLLKSAAASSRETSPSTQSPYVVLCSSDKTFQFRQVQTSNTVFITQSLSEDDSAISEPRAALSAFSTCDSVLELVPSSEDATPYLRDLLLTYNGTEQKPHTDSKRPKAKKDIIADIPLSNHECNQAWTSLIAFELGDNCYLPTPQILFQLWSALLATAIAEDIQLTGEFHAEDLWMHMDHELYPRPLLAGVFAKLCSGSQDMSWDAPRSLEKSVCIQWICDLIVQCELLASDSLMLESLRLQIQDNLPEPWREAVSTQAVQHAVDRKKGNMNEDRDTKLENKKQDSASSARKWHEKFKNSKK